MAGAPPPQFPSTPPLGAGQHGLWYTGAATHGSQGLQSLQGSQLLQPSMPPAATTSTNSAMTIFIGRATSVATRIPSWDRVHAS